jgi:hypothetical protein
MLWRREKSYNSGNRTRAVRPVAIPTLYRLSPDLVANVKMRNLECLGRVIIMGNKGVVNDIVESKPEDRRNQGRATLNK